MFDISFSEAEMVGYAILEFIEDNSSEKADEFNKEEMDFNPYIRLIPS